MLGLEACPWGTIFLSPTSSSPSASLKVFSERGRLHPSPSPPHSVDVGPFCLFLPGRERPLGDLESYAPDLVRETIL